MVIEINSKWAFKQKDLTELELIAFFKEHCFLDQLIFYGRMEQLRLRIYGLRIK